MTEEITTTPPDTTAEQEGVADTAPALPDNPPVETTEAPDQTAPEEIIASAEEAGVLPVETTEPKEDAPVQPIESEEVILETIPENTAESEIPNNPVENTAPAPDIIPPTQTQAPTTPIAPVAPSCETPAEPIEREILEERLEENFIQRLLGNLTKANQKRKIVTQERLEKILTNFSPTDKITNDKVETLLGVSDRAASRYLNTLFKQGKIMKFGKGMHVFYQKYG